MRGMGTERRICINLRNSLQQCEKASQIIVETWGALVMAQGSSFCIGEAGISTVLYENKYLALG